MLDTLSNVKTRLGITTSVDDPFLTQQIQLISDVIELYCRRRFLEADYRQTFYRDGFTESSRLQLYQYPVSEVTLISQDTITFDDVNFRLHKPTGILTAVNGTKFYGPQETIVEYTAGYDTCPAVILSVLDSLVSERYNKKTSGVDLNFGSDVQRISIPGAISIDFDYTLKNNERSSAYGSILGNNANILDDWRSERTIIGSGKLEYVEEV